MIRKFCYVQKVSSLKQEYMVLDTKLRIVKEKLLIPLGRIIPLHPTTLTMIGFACGCVSSIYLAGQQVLFIVSQNFEKKKSKSFQLFSQVHPGSLVLDSESTL